MALKLYGHDPSPFVRRIRVLLTELGLPFERDAHGWLDPVPEFETNAPIKRLPMLDRGPGRAVRYVFESRVIASVLYEEPARAPAADLQPTLFAPGADAADQNLLSAIDGGLETAVNLFLLERDGIAGDATPYLKRQQARVDECLGWADRTYAGRPTFVPGTLAFVDICAATAIGWLRFRQRAEVGRWPNLVAVEAALAGRPSFASTRPG